MLSSNRCHRLYSSCGAGYGSSAVFRRPKEHVFLRYRSRRLASGTCFTSVLPQPLKPVRRKLRVSYGMLDLPMSKIVLDGARVGAFVGEIVAGRVAQHMRVDRELEACNLTCALD